MFVKIARNCYSCSSLLLALLGIFLPLYTDAVGGEFGSLPTLPKNSVCKPIPNNLKLCRNISYSVMRLPNLLGHERMDEIHQQSLSWVPLLPKKCHKDLRMFLCSLFAPVCIEDAPVQIYPCRSLCISVRDACSPVMIQAGFPWPSNLNCTQYPQNEMCIKEQCTGRCKPDGETPDSTPTCSPCGNSLDKETVRDHFCASEFVLKVRIRAVKRTKRDVKLIMERKKRKIYKSGPLTPKQLKRLTLFIQNGAKCSCPQLTEKKKKKGRGKKKRKDYYLVMGRELNRKLLVTVLHRLPKKKREMRKIDKLLDTNVCI